MPVMEMNPTVRTRFGERLRGLRKSLGLKQESLGEALGYSKSMISEIEKGHQAPPLDKAVAIAEYFGIPLDALVKEDYQETSLLLALRQMARGCSVEQRKTLVAYCRTFLDELEQQA